MRLHELGCPVGVFCDQTVLLNEAWCEGTPFEAVTEITAMDAALQTVRRRA
jgi:hypothetical protein